MKPQFGKIANAYSLGRRGYPDKIYEILTDKVGAESFVLDLGCGTGIATRELSAYFESVTGVDFDKGMIKAAENDNDQEIPYFVAKTKELPFPDNYFDLVTAFGSFHWFADNDSIAEIQRVLKPKGTFAVINKNDKNEVRSIFSEVVGSFKGAEKIGTNNRQYRPKTILVEHGFDSVEKVIFSVSEKCSLKRVLQLVQSWNSWSYLSKEEAEKALLLLKDRYESLLVDGFLTREIKIGLVTGQKK